MRRFLVDLFRKRPSSQPQRPPSIRLTLEALEDRVVPALTWSAGVALPAGLAGDAAVVEPNQAIVVLGGGTTSVNQFAAGDTAWSMANPLDVPRSAPGIAVIDAHTLLVFGGASGNSVLGSAILLDPALGGDVNSAAALHTPRRLFAFAADGAGQVYAIGGLAASGSRLASVERYDADAGTWSAVAPLPQARSGAAAVYDGAGHILVFGGAVNGAAASRTVLSYTVATNSWKTLAPLPAAVTEAAAVTGPDGQVYVVGGKFGSSTLATVQVYNPAKNQWTRATALPTGVSDAAAVVDVLNRLEVIGGKDVHGNALADVWVTQSLANVAPQITTTTLPSATPGIAYTATVAATGSPLPTFSVLAGPNGLTVNAATGVVSWLPTMADIGTQTVTVEAASAAGTVTQTFTLAVAPDTTPPSVPVLSVGPLTSTTAIPLTWTAATDNVGVAGYRLYRYTPAVYRGHSGRGGGITLVSPAKYTLIADHLTTTAYTVTGLAPNTTYRYTVAAFDAAGNSSGDSVVVTVTTLRTPALTYSTNGVNSNPPLSVAVGQALYLTLYATGSPVPTLSLVSAPKGVVFTPGVITNSQLTFVIPHLTWTPTAADVGTSHIVMQAVNSVGSFTLDVAVTVTAAA